MTILEQQTLFDIGRYAPLITVHTTAQPDQAGRRCEQVVHDTTGERPQWVTYDPDRVAAIAHLTRNSLSARYALGAAGYQYCTNTSIGELWVRPVQ